MLAGVIVGAIVSGCSQLGPREKPKPSRPELILCGWDEVFILSLAMGPQVTGEKIWSWKAADCAEIPEAMKKSFRTTDDCKPVDGGRKILISSSGGAVALVDRATRRAEFWAAVVNAHSIERLPGDRIAAAASTGKAEGANRIVVFDAASGRELASDELHSAHGVVWDARREVLWALGKDQLRAYSLDLKRQFQIELPDSDGHELAAIPGTSKLFISTGKQCWHFDRDSRQLLPHDVLGEAGNIKSFNVHPATGQVAYVQAEGENWWAEHVHFLRPAGVLRLPGQRLYKVRWA